MEGIGGVEQCLLIRTKRQATHGLVGLAECRHVTFIIIVEVCALTAHIASTIAPKGNLFEDAIGLVCSFRLQCFGCISVSRSQIASELIIIGDREEEVLIIYEHQLSHVIRQTQPFLCFTHAGCQPLIDCEWLTFGDALFVLGLTCAPEDHATIRKQLIAAYVM